MNETNRLNPILLVDDNPMDVELTLTAFRKRHLANPVIVARDGQEALDWIPRWEAGEVLPLVILLDINMPKVGGLEVLQRLKAHSELRVIPVVMLTTSAEPDDVKTAYLDRANSYIVKPVNYENFSRIVEQLEMYWAVLNRPCN